MSEERIERWALVDPGGYVVVEETKDMAQAIVEDSDRIVHLIEVRDTEEIIDRAELAALREQVRMGPPAPAPEATAAPDGTLRAQYVPTTWLDDARKVGDEWKSRAEKAELTVRARDHEIDALRAILKPFADACIDAAVEFSNSWEAWLRIDNDGDQGDEESEKSEEQLRPRPVEVR